jgi:hypothetical protein
MEASVIAIYHLWSVINHMVCFWNHDLKGYTRSFTLIPLPRKSIQAH